MALLGYLGTGYLESLLQASLEEACSKPVGTIMALETPWNTTPQRPWLQAFHAWNTRAIKSFSVEDSDKITYGAPMYNVFTKFWAWFLCCGGSMHDNILNFRKDAMHFKLAGADHSGI